MRIRGGSVVERQVRPRILRRRNRETSPAVKSGPRTDLIRVHKLGDSSCSRTIETGGDQLPRLGHRTDKKSSYEVILNILETE